MRGHPLGAYRQLPVVRSLSVTTDEPRPVKTIAATQPPFFPLTTQQLHLAIEGLAQAGTSARTIAAAVEVGMLTVC